MVLLTKFGSLGREMKRNGSGRPRPRNVGVVWDEANLNYLEANKSPKQKITEPKTPYHAPAHEDGSISPIAGEDRTFLDQATQAEEICHALMEAASTSSSQRRSRGGWTSSEDEADEMDQDSEGVGPNSHGLSFQEHRKAHYDEYRKLKALRRTVAQPEEEEEFLLQETAQGIQDHAGTLAGDMGAFGLEETVASTDSHDVNPFSSQ